MVSVSLFTCGCSSSFSRFQALAPARRSPSVSMPIDVGRCRQAIRFRVPRSSPSHPLSPFMSLRPWPGAQHAPAMWSGLRPTRLFSPMTRSRVGIHPMISGVGRRSDWSSCLATSFPERLRTVPSFGSRGFALLRRQTVIRRVCDPSQEGLPAAGASQRDASLSGRYLIAARPVSSRSTRSLFSVGSSFAGPWNSSRAGLPAAQ